jgi:hypothetical protein
MAVDRIGTILKAVGYEVVMRGRISARQCPVPDLAAVLIDSQSTSSGHSLSDHPAQRVAGLWPGIGTRKNTAEAMKLPDRAYGLVNSSAVAGPRTVRPRNNRLPQTL